MGKALCGIWTLRRIQCDHLAEKVLEAVCSKLALVCFDEAHVIFVSLLGAFKLAVLSMTEGVLPVVHQEENYPC